MRERNNTSERSDQATRREFLERCGQAAVVGGLAAPLLSASSAAAAPDATPGKVRYRQLGKTGLRVSEIGFGGHSWSVAQVPDGRGGMRRPTVDEAVEMIRAGLEMGVNFIDACTPAEEHTTPGEVLRRLKCRDRLVISARCCHKMKGVPADKDNVALFVEQRLKMWQIDCFDILMLSNTADDTPDSGYWDMSYSLDAVERMKQQGKIRFAGFGSHFSHEWFGVAFEKFGKAFDLCSVPYNVRHRGAEQIMPGAEKLGLGIVTIKPLARGELLRGRDLQRSDAGLVRDMIAFVLENKLVDVCICGVHTSAQVRENLSASWTPLSPEGRRRLQTVGAGGLGAGELAWLENHWRLLA